MFWVSFPCYQAAQIPCLYFDVTWSENLIKTMSPSCRVKSIYREEYLLMTIVQMLLRFLSWMTFPITWLGFVCFWHLLPFKNAVQTFNSSRGKSEGFYNSVSEIFLEMRRAIRNMLRTLSDLLANSLSQVKEVGSLFYLDWHYLQ